MHLQHLPPTRYVSGCGRNDDPYLPHVGLGMAATRETKYTVCTYCRVTITPYKKLLEHVTAAHRGKRPFECLQCGRTFTQQAHRDAHLRIHTGERPYVCDKCGDSFKQSGHLQRHKRRYHEPLCQLPFKCDKCSSTFAQKWDLDMHDLAHHKKGLEARPYECHKCGCAFTQPSNLKRHLKGVDCTANCKCEECGQNFSSAGHLRLHMSNVHSQS